MKLVDFFDRIYVLNLPERTDRRRHMERELARMGMPFELDKVRLFPAIKPESKEPFRKLGSKGCFLSTMQMLKAVRDENLNNVLILQDDAQFAPDFADFEASLVEDLAARDWDIAQFGYGFANNEASEAYRQFIDANPCDRGTLLPYSGELIGAHCFAINGKSLSEFIGFLELLLSRPLGHPEGGPMPIDGSFNRFSRRDGATRLILVPSLVGQLSSRSDVTPSWHDRSPLLRPVASIARRFGVTGAVRKTLKKLKGKV